MVKEGLQAAKEELCTQAMALDRARQEASEVENSVERLIKECNAFRGDLQRQEALVSQRDGVIAELRDEACTSWASRWLAFQRKAAKVFLGLNLDFQVLDEEEAEESVSKDEADPRMFSDAPSFAPLPGKPEIPAKAGPPLLPVGASPSNSHGLEAHTTEAAHSSTSDV